MTTPNCALWMQNQDGQDPCTTAQEVGQLCNSTYVVSSVNFQESQYVPNTPIANGCTCSWSIYNLLSACASCVGDSQLISWNTWTASCGGYVSNNLYLPSNLSLPQGIPYWAVTNPATWYNGVFNVTQASGIAAADKPDVTGGPVPTSSIPASSSSSSKTSVGAIVGGVIGGVVIVVISGVLIFCLLRRRRRLQQPVKDPAGVLNGVQPIVTPTTLMRGPNGITVQPASSQTMISSSMTSLVSPVSGGYSPNEHGPNAAAFMTSPFYGQKQTQTNAASTTSPTRKATEARAERAVSQPAQRARLNPPPYSPSAPPESSDTTPTWKRRLSTKKHTKRTSSVSGATSRPARSGVLAQESAGPRAGPSRSYTAIEGGERVEGHGGQGINDGGAVVSHERPPAV